MTSEYQVDPLTPHLGARVSGLSLSPDLSGDAVGAVRDLVDQHYVVAFADQSLSPVNLRDLTSQFGSLFEHHAEDGVIRCDEAPEVLQMLKEPDGARLFGGADWHADVTFRNPAAYLSVLHAIELPSLGGDTLFASTVAAYNALSDGMKHTLGNLNAVHSYSGRGHPDDPEQSALHPVIRRHPVTGVRGIYVNRMFTTRFEGMSQAESEPIIDFLDRHISSPEFTCRMTWQPGQVVMWDNRFTLHYPSNDFTNQRRLLIRCTAMESVAS